jgi:hypothetical protein
LLDNKRLSTLTAQDSERKESLLAMVAELSAANESLKESLRDQNEFASLESKNAILEQELAKVKRRRGEGLKEPHVRFETIAPGRVLTGVYRIRSKVRLCLCPSLSYCHS